MTFGRIGLAMAIFLAGHLVAAQQAVDSAAVDKAFEALKTYQWGTNRSLLKPIDDAVRATHKNPEARRPLEARLAAVLATKAPAAAKYYVCRKLRLIGTGRSVPLLAPLLLDKSLSHMARFALEPMPHPKAGKALRDALPKAGGNQKIGIINSLGIRRDAKSVAALIPVLESSEDEIRSAAAAALGSIGTPQTAKALSAYLEKVPRRLRLAAIDAYLMCAERLLADGKKEAAVAIYKALASPDQSARVRRAASLGLAAARK